jgi:hypothetical protein
MKPSVWTYAADTDAARPMLNPWNWEQDRDGMGVEYNAFHEPTGAYLWAGRHDDRAWTWAVSIEVENHTRWEQDWRTVFEADGTAICKADAMFRAQRALARWMIVDDVLTAAEEADMEQWAAEESAYMADLLDATDTRGR